MRSAARFRRFATVCRRTIARRSTGCRPRACSWRVWSCVGRDARTPQLQPRSRCRRRPVATGGAGDQHSQRGVSRAIAPGHDRGGSGRVAAGAALVEIAIYRPFNNRVVQRDKRFGAARYVAYVVRPGAEPASVDLGDVTAIDAQVETLRRALSNTKRPDPKSAATALLSESVRPLLPLLGDSQRLFISPDGSLNLVPFAALQDPRAGILWSLTTSAI